MTATPDAIRARRYLLGEASDEECAVIEQEYLADEDALELIASAEDDLIEDYLTDNLTPAHRQLFEQGYLASPQHRVRVDTISRLIAEGAKAAPAPTPAASPASDPGVTAARTIPFPSSAPRRKLMTRQAQWAVALAASLILVAGVTFVLFTNASRQPDQSQIAQNQPAQQTPQTQQPQTPAPTSGAPSTTPSTPSTVPAAPRVFALTVSPASVRGTSESRPVRIPADTEVVAIHLAREAAAGSLTPRRASIRTVTGTEVWRGAVAHDGAGPRGTIGRLDVPAGKLPADDYLITLYGTTPAGAEREWAQYFLAVRADRTQ